MTRTLVRLLLRVCSAFLVLAVVPMVMGQTQNAGGATEREMPMAADASPSLLVAAIRPSDPNAPHAADGWTFESEGHDVSCKRATVVDIIAGAYGLQVRQIVGGPAWLSKDRYDVRGVPDVPGVPDVAQLRGMYQKLLAERFHLVLHRERRAMPVYAITVAKSGPHLKVAGSGERINTGNSGDGHQRTLRFTNMPMSEFAHNLDIY